MNNRLKLLRVERDWTQGDLAEALGVSRQTVNALETGKYDPSLPLAFRIGSLFGLAIEEIFQPDGSPQARLSTGNAERKLGASAESKTKE